MKVQLDYLMTTASHAFQNSVLSPAEGQEKEAFRQELELVVQSAMSVYEDNKLNPQTVKLRCYGSLANGFALKGSDLDLLLAFPKAQDSLSHIEMECRRMLEKALLDKGYGARLLTKTRVPILRVCQKPSAELLDNLRQSRKQWEAEEKEPGEELPGRLDANRLPQLTRDLSTTGVDFFNKLDVTPAEIPLPPSPIRDHANLEYKGDVGIQCDINFSNYVALHNTALLRCYCKCDSRVREMGVFVKAWAKARKINTTYYGTLSSYGYLMMVLHYLMNIANPPVIPNLQHRARDADAWANKTDIPLFEGFDVRFVGDETWIERQSRDGQLTENTESLGSLLRGFFWYYADSRGFHWTHEAISIRTVGGLLTKKSKGWTEAKRAGENNEIRLRYLLAIEDPFEVEHNIARTVGHHGLVTIRDEFRRAWDIINKIEFARGIGFQWRKSDGRIGEEFMKEYEDRGDLLRQDQEYHRKKQVEMRAAMKMKEEAAKAQSEKRTENGTSSVYTPFARTNAELPDAEPADSKLIPNLHNPQGTPKQKMGRRRKVRRNSDGSGQDGNDTSPMTFLQKEATPFEPLHVSGNSQENQASEQSIASTELETQSSEKVKKEPDTYQPFEDQQRPSPRPPLRLKDVCVPAEPGNEGKPLAWNCLTTAGSWLNWRDKKIRGGEWVGTLHAKNLSAHLDRSFPFDPARPPSHPAQQKRIIAVRDKRMAYFGSQATQDMADSEAGGLDKKQLEDAVPNENELPHPPQTRKDSAISGLTGSNSAKVRQSRHPSPRYPAREPSSHTATPPGAQQTLPRAIAQSSITSSNQRSNSPASVETDEQKYDLSLPSRDKDHNIMPIPRVAGFQFDSRQLRDLEVIRQGGNGCAREGEEWNIEIEGEWGGGGMMGLKESSSGLMMTTSGGARLSGNGEVEERECGRGDQENLLWEMPGLEAE